MRGQSAAQGLPDVHALTSLLFLGFVVTSPTYTGTCLSPLAVDETASKAKFLQAFHRSSANGATAAGTVDTAVPEQAPQHDCPDGEQEVWEEEEQAAQQEEVIDLVEEEDEEIETDGSGGGIGSGTGAVQAGESPQALAGLAAAGDDPAAAAAAVPAIASPAAAPVASPPAEEGGEGPSDPLLHQLLSVLGEEVSKQQGRQLLVAAGGDLQGAVNGYYDGLATAAAAGSGRGKDAATVASPAPSTAADSSRGGGGGAGGGIKRPAPTPATKPKGKKQKGRAAVAASPGQRNITSFFTKQQGPPQGQRQQQEPQEQQQDSGGAAAVAAADAAAGGDLLADDEDLALTLNVPLAASPSAAAAAAAAAGQAAAGVSEVEPDALAAPSGKPKLVLPPPPSPGSAAAASAKGAAGGSFFLSGRGAGGQTGSGGGGSREAAVPRDALALPLERYDPVAHACWEPGEPLLRHSWGSRCMPHAQLHCSTAMHLRPVAAQRACYGSVSRPHSRAPSCWHGWLTPTACPCLRRRAHPVPPPCPRL